ncbi:DUF3784 domain-containing protein [Cesiribacter andamanensis]|uniref:DUF3784 domain-containing protein n=1 Tax=Cesiribacter andamanensis AMV16 TaxID=1279009 RepID=M7N4C4_9BACT|nr:DUF3784 domain-containing protein [Cesiribacter andamanensis]EMR02071.1 hypothetical protein ADICEAN_02817 [Cesiribacter andamanensis AMV16]
MSTFLLFLLALVACLILYIGWQLRFRYRLELLAGYNPTVTRNKKGLARWSGTTLLVIGPLLELCVAAAIKTGFVLLASLAYVAVICIGLIVLALGATQYSNWN